ncbi:MAG: Hsp20/alpha crystallin family protein [Candidatus Marsarchaeota archaeon]
MSIRKPSRFEPLADLSDRGSYYLFTIDLPHVNRDDVHIYLDGDNLVVHAETTYTDDEGAFNHIVYDRQISIPRDADPSSIRVSFKGGMLKVTMNKSTTGKREIPIRRGPDDESNSNPHSPILFVLNSERYLSAHMSTPKEDERQPDI